MSGLDEAGSANRPPGDGTGHRAVGAGTSRDWTVHDQGRQFGPHTEMEIAILFASGSISHTALVWRTGSPRWIPVTALVPMPARSVSALPAVVPNRAMSPNNKLAAGLCGILLGPLGIHKFILGYTSTGIIMLVVSFVGGLCYGLGFFIMAIIGFIEGIIYLSKTDAQFRQDYVVNRREWF